MLIRFFIIFLVSMSMCLPLWAQEADISTFSKLPIMHQGRIKPMISFAEAQYKMLSGSKADAMPWLVEVLFNPALAETRLCIKIINPAVLNFLDLDKRAHKLYSYQELYEALVARREEVSSLLDLPADDLTSAQKDLVMLQQKVALLGDLISSLSLFVPLSIHIPEDSPKIFQPYTNKNLSYTDSLKFRAELTEFLNHLIKYKGEDIKKYSKNETALTYYAFALANLRIAGSRSEIFRVIPRQEDPWLSPWTVVEGSVGNPNTALIFKDWQNLTRAYHSNDLKAWDNQIKQIYEHTSSQISDTHIKSALKLEWLYMNMKPLETSMLFYASALLLLVAGYFIFQKKLNLFAAYALSGGLIAHLTGILMRIYVLDRPPVSTLYESIIFVGFIVVLYALINWKNQKNIFWLYLAAGTGFTLHMLGLSQNQDGDSMLKLTAVLNTNFWLATHVICITAGYAFCLITSILAHIILGKTIIAGHKSFSHALIHKLHKAALIALLFASVGTVLGGIWADQSWGRFWGWDPKENGALLIVLWLIWVLHGRISGQMSALLYVCYLAYLSVIVALSWFGVNLLSVGLHSYGFTDSASLVLCGFIALESALIGYFFWLLKQRGFHAKAL